MIYIGRALLSLLFGGPGAFLVWATSRAIGRRRRWLVEGVVLEGEVVGFKERRNRGRTRGRPLLAPVVSYGAGTAKSGQFTSSEAAGSSAYVVGERVLVRRLTTGDRQEYELDDVVRSVWAILAVASLAAACLLIACLPLAITVFERHR